MNTSHQTGSAGRFARNSLAAHNLLTFLCAATVIAYLQRSAIGVPSKVIGRELSISPQEMGQVWLVWYLGYAFFQIPAGLVADRIGSKAALIGFAVCWSLLTALTGVATGFTSLLLLWGVMGIAQAGIFVCAAKAIGATFQRTEQAFASGALACCMAGGAALSQYLTGQLLGTLSWQEILVVYAVPGLVWGVAFALVVPRPDAPLAHPPPADQPDDWAALPPKPAEPVQWSRLLTDPQMLLLCAQQFQRAAAAALFFTWFHDSCRKRRLNEAKPAASRRGCSWPGWSVGYWAERCPTGCCAEPEHSPQPAGAGMPDNSESVRLVRRTTPKPSRAW